MKYRNIEMRGIQFVRKNDHEKKKKSRQKILFFLRDSLFTTHSCDSWLCVQVRYT